MSERQGSSATYDVWAERGVMVTMRDGIRLATDLYLPGRDGRDQQGKENGQHTAHGGPRRESHRNNLASV